jgi:hypothetical protein
MTGGRAVEMAAAFGFAMIITSPETVLAFRGFVNVRTGGRKILSG